jgi:hypothetical protein
MQKSRYAGDCFISFPFNRTMFSGQPPPLTNRLPYFVWYVAEGMG